MITLPYPPSANRYWRVVNGRPVTSAKARAYKEEAGWLAKAHGVKMLHGDVGVTLTVYRPQRRGDLDNTLKVLLDALEGIAYENDSQVVQIIATRREDKNNPRVEVDIIHLDY